MSRFRQVLDTVKSNLSKLTVSQKLLIGSLCVVMLMTLFLVQQYTGSPTLSPLLPGLGSEEQQEAIQFLDANHIEYQLSRDGQPMVAPERRYSVLAQMNSQGKLPGDKRLLLDELAKEKNSWTRSAQQNKQAEIIAVQNELNRIISQMDGVRSASVLMDIPASRSLGEPSRAPTAAVTVFTDGGMSRSMIDAIAHLVAGSRSGLAVDRVRVIDGTTRQQFRARDESALSASTYEERQIAVEDRTQRKVSDLLSSYIPGVVVAVHAIVENSQRTSETSEVLPEGKGTTSVLVHEVANETRTSEAARGAEPGVRANTGADISGSSAGGAGSQQTETESSFEAEFGRAVERRVTPGGFPIKINAVVNIPRPYFEEIWRRRQATSAASPAGAAPDAAAPASPSDTDQTFQQIQKDEIARIRAEVEKLIDTTHAENTVKGQVEVSMIPTMPDLGGAGGPSSAGLLNLGGGEVLALGDLIRTIGLGGLALMSLGLVVMTALKANKREQLPSASELVGVPPALEPNADLVGEAGAADPVLAGIELTEDDMKLRKVAEQVQAMVKERPADAAAIIGRWVTAAD